MTINPTKNMTQTEIANDIDMTKSQDDMVRLQDRAKAAYEQTLKQALDSGINSFDGTTLLKKAADYQRDYAAARDAEVLIANFQYAVRTAAGKRSAEDLRRLTGS